jgi:hypothetical protein
MDMYDTNAPDRAHNHTRLPLELWCHIDAHISVRDAVALASTCVNTHKPLMSLVYSSVRYVTPDSACFLVALTDAVVAPSLEIAKTAMPRNMPFLGVRTETNWSWPSGWSERTS